MSPNQQSIWELLAHYLNSCCRCSIKPESYSETSSENAPKHPYSIFDNPALEADGQDDFTIEVLDMPCKGWQHHELSKFQDSNFMSTDLTIEEPEILPTCETKHRTDTKSTSRESGYGQSIKESQGSSSDTDLSVAVIEAKSKTTYKLIVQDQKKCWYVFRRQLEFVFVQEYIKKEVGILGKDLPVGKKAKLEDIQNFLQKVTSDPKLLQLQKVREFLHIDRHHSTSSSGSTDSTVITNQPRTKATLIHKIPSPPRPPQPNSILTAENGVCDSQNALTRVASVPLGCEERRLAPSDFEFLCLVGKGSFGKVMLARKKEDKRVYAVKVLSKKLILRKNETAHVLSERSVLTRVLRHPYVVQLHYAFTTPSKIFFVLDYVNGGELFYHLQKERLFSERRARFYAAEICCALTYMHSKGILYRDLKPENILLDKEGHIVLTDFGLCKEGLDTSSSRTSTFCGTPEYLAPEVILKRPYTRSVDWWTYGAVLYEMLFGTPPFYYKDTMVMYEAIISKPLRLRSSISPNAKDILFSLLQKSPTKRLGSGPKDGSEVKSHCFFTSIRWSQIEKRAFPPPFVPNVTSDDDTSNIDPAFTSEPVLIAPSTPPSAYENKAFRGFSYVSPDIDDYEGER